MTTYNIQAGMEQFDVICVGTSFATTFFLHKYLKKSKPTARILVLEGGKKYTHDWQLRPKRTTNLLDNSDFVNNHPKKKWVHHPSFGGRSNSWWGCTPRFMPNDFKMKSIYGVGTDWPLTYDELEEYYCEAEAIMAISGPKGKTPYPRSRPYPQPPHLLSEPDKLLEKANPDQYFSQPCARARIDTPNRLACAAIGVCYICPLDAKFTIINEMNHIFENPRITLMLEAKVQTVETCGNVATGLTYIKNGIVKTVKGDLIVLGANSIFNPFIMLRSNLHHPLLGKNLHEQVSIYVRVDLDGVDNYQGSTSITGHGYMLYDGEHRSDHSACLIESYNIPHIGGALRMEKGRWRQRMILKFIFEDLPDVRNYVKINNEKPYLAETVYVGHSDYAQRALDKLPEILPKLLRPLPVESIKIAEDINSTDSHILGTTVMGNDPKKSIIDKYLIHHKIRNLVILGSGAFPTSSPANPALTLSALSLWSADNLLR